MKDDPVPFSRLPRRGALYQKPLIAGLARIRSVSDLEHFITRIHIGIDLG